MEIYNQPEDLITFGILVKNFPNGIKEAFDLLIKIFGNDRDYYGISWMDEDNNVKYYAMSPEVFKDEAKQYYYEKLLIPKGEYHAETIHNWLSKTDRIKDVFHKLMPDNKPDENHPAIEWYKSDDEMLCMVKA